MSLEKTWPINLIIPLTGVKSMIQILSHQPELEGFTEELVEVEKAVKRSQKIIESLLSFSQIQEKQEFCDLNQVVEGSLLLLKSMTKRLLLKIDLCKQPVEVKGDFSILQQVAYNLILNSCQALKEDKDNRKACIQISTKRISNNKALFKNNRQWPWNSKTKPGKNFSGFLDKQKKRTRDRFRLGDC